MLESKSHLRQGRGGGETGTYLRRPPRVERRCSLGIKRSDYWWRVTVLEDTLDKSPRKVTLLALADFGKPSLMEKPTFTHH